MDILLRGVRGSIATSSVETDFYGGNTACVEVSTSGGATLFFDAGTGIREAGEFFPDKGTCYLFISHGHADHIQGLGFFKPLHSSGWVTHLYLPKEISHVPTLFFSDALFPIPFSSFAGVIVPHALEAGERFSLPGAPDVAIETFATNHPGGGLAYKMFSDGEVFFYSGDHEITDAQEMREQTAAMLQDVDFAVVDAMYSKEDYKPGWGHSCWEDWVEMAHEAKVKVLLLSHHAPDRSDTELDTMQLEIGGYSVSETIVLIGRQGMILPIPFPENYSVQTSDWMEYFLDDLDRYKEVGVVLDRILAKAREITFADAGTVFLVEGDELVFAYTHNDTLFSVDSAYKFAYATMRLPIRTNSIAGYCAVTGSAVNIPDVYHIPDDAPYTFNRNFDDSTGYRTTSVLAVPLFDKSHQLLGVIQIINSQPSGPGKSYPFSSAMMQRVKEIAMATSHILERSAFLRSSIGRLIRTATVHDPSETGPHAERVGAIAAELYQRWGEKHSIGQDVIRFERGNIRLAAMLHDIGKVGISDAILKKPGKLTDEEFRVMRGHTKLGEGILSDDTEYIMALARNIALHHHQKWNGRGYAGVTDEGLLAGDKIPLPARITAVADVFDALVSPRCYKNPWTMDKAIEILQKDAGSHFDPELVACMEEILEIVPKIYERYPDILEEKKES